MGKQPSTGFALDNIVDDRCIVTAVHGAFYGSVMPAAAIEAMIAAHVPKKHLQEVAEVYNTKWWDYRSMAPGHCFMLFANSYYKQFKIAASRMLKHRKRGSGPIGQNNGGVGIIGIGEIHFTAESIWERPSSHITSMWNAMMTADAIGIPYPEFCRLGNQFAFDNAWDRLPKPNHLYSQKVLGSVCDEWVKLSGEKMFTAKHPQYLVVNYAHEPTQDAYRDWLVCEVDRRDNPVPGLANCVYTTPQIPEDMALQHFPRQAVMRAKAIAG